MAGPLPFYISPTPLNYRQSSSPFQNFLRFFSCRRRSSFENCASLRFRHAKFVAFLALLFIAAVCYIGGFSMLPDDDGSAARSSDGSNDLSKKMPKNLADTAVLAGQIPKPKLDDEMRRLDETKEKSKLWSNANLGFNEAEANATFVKEMMIFAWDNYKKYAWSRNELQPVLKTGHSASIFGQTDMGATIVDAMDTLFIMGLFDRFNESKNWVNNSFRFSEVHGDVSVFETTIRFIGGFLSCFALTGDTLFKQKAQDVAKLMLPAFNTPSGIPYGLINIQNGRGSNYGWTPGGSSILSEFGSLSLEFDYLSVITGDQLYSNKMRRIREVLNSLEIEKSNGLYTNYIHPETGKGKSMQVSMGALGDSFYEYLLKSWLITSKRDVEGLEMYEKAIEGFQKKLFGRSQDDLFYIAELSHNRVDPKMGHLACFAGGMFALHAVNSHNATVRDYWLTKAEELAHTCHESYVRTATKLGPETFWFTGKLSAKTEINKEKYYILRPEVVETWFYLWRLTKKQKYRDWAWEAVQAIEKYCKILDADGNGGYSGIRDVYNVDSPKDGWVFNTEAHPLPIRLDDQDHAPGSASRNLMISKNLVDDNPNNNGDAQQQNQSDQDDFQENAIDA